MLNPSSLSTRWNIFARELEDVLDGYGLKLSHLDDRGVVHHREKVRRLQQSLKSPSHLTTLNPEEMDRLIVVMRLTDLEQKRLRAALLATAVEMTLMDRVDAETALMAADDVFTILFAAMRAQPDSVMNKGVKAGMMTDKDDEAGDAAFSQALDLFDRAMLALHVSRNAATFQAQVVHARESFDAFSRAMDCLRQTQSPPPQSEDWRYWFDEVSAGQKMAESLMNAKEGA